MITKMWEAFIDELEGMEIPYLIPKDEELVIMTINDSTFFMYYDNRTMDWWFGEIIPAHYKGGISGFTKKVLAGRSKWLLEDALVHPIEYVYDQSPQYALDKVKLISGCF